MPTMIPVLTTDAVTTRILLIRGQRVMLDADLAELYGVTTKRFNEQVKRNLSRFPADFMFQITVDEKIEVVAHCDHLAKLKFSRTCPTPSPDTAPSWLRPSSTRTGPRK